MAEYVDHGALWPHSDGEDFTGRIYGVEVCVRRNGVSGEKLPAYHIFSPDETKDIGALWAKSSNRDGTRYYSGSITINGQKQPVSLWPANRKHDRSPAWRVMPPREEVRAAPQPLSAAVEDDDSPF